MLRKVLFWTLFAGGCLLAVLNHVAGAVLLMFLLAGMFANKIDELLDLASDEGCCCEGDDEDCPDDVSDRVDAWFDDRDLSEDEVEWVEVPLPMFRDLADRTAKS